MLHGKVKKSAGEIEKSTYLFDSSMRFGKSRFRNSCLSELPVFVCDTINDSFRKKMVRKQLKIREFWDQSNLYIKKNVCASFSDNNYRKILILAYPLVKDSEVM